MTFLARHNGMAADQRKACEVVVEADFLPPTSLPVTSFAAATELSLMWIVLLVAGHTGRCELVAIEIARMTGVTLDLRVAATQWILGPLVVIEADTLPFGQVVARLAFGTIATPMSILHAVTRYAARGEVFVNFARVAGRAGDRLV